MHRSDASERHTISIAGLGDFTLHLLVSEDLPREVQILRNGIYIADNFAKFSKPFRQFRGTREFTAVLEPARTQEGRKPSALLKKLENPAHDAFEPDRISDPDDREVARKQIKKLADQVRDIIRNFAHIEESDRSELDELSQMFATTGATRDDERADVEKDPDAFIYKMSRRIIRRNTAGLSGKGKGKSVAERTAQSPRQEPATETEPVSATEVVQRFRWKRYALQWMLQILASDRSGLHRVLPEIWKSQSLRSASRMISNFALPVPQQRRCSRAGSGQV
jgi:Asp-tRNA(Asn)/Glu-tRNA(Gln) amidotransferase C subunit